jgi:hypothetical protein
VTTEINTDSKDDFVFWQTRSWYHFPHKSLCHRLSSLLFRKVYYPFRMKVMKRISCVIEESEHGGDISYHPVDKEYCHSTHTAPNLQTCCLVLPTIFRPPWRHRTVGRSPPLSNHPSDPVHDSAYYELHYNNGWESRITRETMCT